MSRFSVIPAYCLADSRLSPRDLTVLGTIGIHTNKHGYARPSLGRMAKILGISRQAVQKSIRHLVAVGYLECTKRSRQNGSQTSNEYRILFDLACDEKYQRVQSFIEEADDEGVQPVVAGGATSGVAGGATSGVAPRTTQINEGKKNSSPSQSKLIDELPDYIAKESWDGYVDMRKRKKKPLTDRATKLLLNKLAKFQADGHDVNDLLDRSTMNCWTDVWLRDEERGGKNGADGASRAGPHAPLFAGKGDRA